MSSTPPVPTLLSHLGQKIHELSDDKVATIAGLLDHGGHNPHALEGRAILRERLRVLRPARRLSPCRLFCVPFEMMLSDGDQATSDPLRPIARSAILPTWHEVEARLPADVRAAVVTAAAAAASIDDDNLRAAGAALWAESRRIIAASFDAIASQAGDPRWLRGMGAAFDARDPILSLRALLKDCDRHAPDRTVAIPVIAQIQKALRFGEAPAYAATVTASLHFSSPALVLGMLRRSGLGMQPGAGQPMILRFCDAMLRDVDRELVSLPQALEGIEETFEGVGSVADSISELTAVAARLRDPALKGRIVRTQGFTRRLVVDLLLPRLDAEMARPEVRSAVASSVVDSVVRTLLRARAIAPVLGIEKDVAALERKHVYVHVPVQPPTAAASWRRVG